MQFMSKSKNANRPTRKKDRKVQRKFNSSLRSKTDDATRLAQRTAKVTEAEKALADAKSAAKVAQDAVTQAGKHLDDETARCLVAQEGKTPEEALAIRQGYKDDNGQGLQELARACSKFVNNAKGAEDVVDQKLEALHKVQRQVETKNRGEALARARRRAVCAPGSLQNANLEARGFHLQGVPPGAVTGRITTDKPNMELVDKELDKPEVLRHVQVEAVGPNDEIFF